MTEPFAKPADTLTRAIWIDGVCDEFEAAWLAGQSPQIQDFLDRVAEEGRAALALELIPLDIHYRQRMGERVDLPVSHGPQADSAGDAPLAAAQQGTMIRIGTYEVLQEIARGGMGIVFKGRDTHLWREVAVKVLLERHQGEAELIKRFVDEAQISGQLQHPGIAPIYELGEVPDGRPYFTMKLVKGETLANQLAARGNPQEDRERFLRIFEQICQTLAYAHSRGVIHRDLKPSNIMVGAFGEVQVMDWGLAKVLAEGESPQVPPANVSVIRTARSGGFDESTGSHTQFGSVLGTLAYMPPEQALGEIDHLDQRADVFGLGAILCEILTGRPPYVAASFEQLRRQAVRAELSQAFESLDRCGADEELTRLTRRALAPEPADRPTDAGVLARELISYREGVEKRLRQAELAEAQAITRAVEERSRRKLTLAFSGTLLTVLAIGVIGTTWGLARTGKAKESLRRELYVADLQLANQMWESENGTAKNVAALLAGHVPLEGQTDLREFAWRLQWTAINQNSLVLKGHGRGASLVAFLSDGNGATLDGELTMRRWKLPEGTLLAEAGLQGASQASCWAISAEGQRVAVGSGDRVYVFDTQTGKELLVLSGEALALGLTFSADGRHLAGVWSDGRAQVWEAASGKESASLIAKFPDQISARKRIKLALEGQSLFLLDYPDLSQISCLTVGHSESLCPEEHYSSVHSIALSPDGKWRATGDANGQVCLSESATPSAQDSILRAHRGSVSALVFSTDGERLATGGADGTVTIWDVARREELYSFKGHLGRIYSLSFAPDGLTVASASDDGNARVWNLLSDRSSRVLDAYNLPVFSLAYSPDGDHLAIGTSSQSASSDGTVQIWHVRSGERVRTFDAAEGRVLALAYSRNGRALITGGFDSHVRVWDADTGSEVRDIPGLVSDPPVHFFQSAIGTLAVSPDGRFVAAGFGHPTYHQSDYQQVAKVWNLTTGAELATLRGHFNTICEVTFSGDGKLLATASDDQQVKLWSVENWQVVHTLQGTEQFQSVTFSNDGEWILAGGVSGAVTIWETAGGRLVKQLRGHAGAVQRLVFSPDGRTLATAGWDNTIKLWDPVSGRETRTLRGHRDWISCLAFAPDGNTLATGSFDAKVRLWEAASWPEIAALVAENRKLADHGETQRRQQRQARATRPIAELTPGLLDRYMGSYDRGLLVQRNGDYLVLNSLPGARGAGVAFHPASETEFFCRDREIDIRFLMSAEGRVDSIVIYQDGEAVEAKRSLAE